MNDTQKRLEQILLRHLERFLGTERDGIAVPLNLINIALIIFLAEQAANERDQLISADDRYTHDGLFNELTEVGIGSETDYNQAIEIMLEKTFIHQDESGRLVAGEALVEVAQLVDSVLPNMPGLNLIAYFAQTLDEAASGRKTLQDAAAQFDQTMALQGVALSGQQDPSFEKSGPKQPGGKRDDKSSLSAEATQRLIKSAQKEIERKPTRQSKVLSCGSQMQYRTVAFGKTEVLQDSETQDSQQDISRPDPTGEVQDLETTIGVASPDIQAEIPSEAKLKSDSDVSVKEPNILDDLASEEPFSKNDQIEITEDPDLTAVTEPTESLPEQDSTGKPMPEDAITPATAQASKSQQMILEGIDHTEAEPDQLETTDDIIEKEINNFEKDLAMQCPICKSARIVSELTTKGKEYYKCPNKSCNFISWGKPFHNECPRCRNPFLIEAQKNGKNILKCPRATCNYWQGETETSRPSTPKANTQVAPSNSKSGPAKRRRRVVKRRVVRRKK